MQIVYDYIVTTVIFFLIFSFSIASLLNIVETPMRHISEQQLTTKAETVLGNLLGYIGDPKGWANNISLRPSDLRAVGLSRMPKADVIYDLDMDALARLKPIDTGATIDQDTLYKLLNLGKDYRFALTLTPILNITITPTRYVANRPQGPAPPGEYFACSFRVTVRTHELTPVANVNLTAYMLTAYFDKLETTLFYETNETKFNVTRWDGAATFNYTAFMTDQIGQKIAHTYLAGTLFIVVGDFYGMQTMTVFQTSTHPPLLEGIQVGKYIIFQDVGGVSLPHGHKHRLTYDSAECVFNGVFVTEVVPSTIGSQCPWLVHHNGKDYFVMELQYLEPDMYWVAFVVRYHGNEYGLVYFPRIPANFHIGEAIPRGTRVVGIRRVVFIEKMAFFADFYFWRTSG